MYKWTEKQNVLKFSLYHNKQSSILTSLKRPMLTVSFMTLNRGLHGLLTKHLRQKIGLC
jgi:hypothetical protein